MIVLSLVGSIQRTLPSSDYITTHIILSPVHTLNICDMIKGNESDVRNINFELQAKRGDKFFTLFLNFKEFPISLQPDIWFRCSLDENVAF